MVDERGFGLASANSAGISWESVHSDEPPGDSGMSTFTGVVKQKMAAACPVEEGLTDISIVNFCYRHPW